MSEDADRRVFRLAALADQLASRPGHASGLLIAAATEILIAEIGAERASEALGAIVAGAQHRIHEGYGAIEASH